MSYNIRAELLFGRYKMRDFPKNRNRKFETHTRDETTVKY